LALHCHNACGLTLDGAPMSVLDKTNFREAAQNAVSAYHKRGAILDALFWATIIRFYEEALAEKEKALAGKVS